MYDIVALGELLIDFTTCGRSAAGMRLFEQNPGGAVCNVLAAMARQGDSAAFIGKIGNDMHGRFLRQSIESVGIDTRGVVEADDVFTTLAFVELSETGERTFSFARKPGADTCLTTSELNEELLKHTRVFHVGSLSLTNEPARSATFRAIEIAKAAGAVISYDPNYRAPLWDGVETAKQQMRSLLPYVDVMKLSDEETALLTDREDPAEALRFLYDAGIPCAAVTMGPKGALVMLRGETAVAGPHDCVRVDTTGAGDAFWGGFLHGLLQSGKEIGTLTLDDAVSFAHLANVIAAICCERRGALLSMPTAEEVRRRLSSR
ncbi:MAG: carbohydrate kinase [Eubacteriales bacterium]|nr:carbohydrate kinase [Eubacteriales bacterium]